MTAERHQAIGLHVERRDHEQVSFFVDRSSGLRAIVAIHDTTLGPSLGGARMWPYESDEAALEDALRLSQGMTYKAAIAGLDLGGVAIGIDRYGASAPGELVLERLGINVANVVDAVKRVLAKG